MDVGNLTALVFFPYQLVMFVCVPQLWCVPETLQLLAASCRTLASHKVHGPHGLGNAAAHQ